MPKPLVLNPKNYWHNVIKDIERSARLNNKAGRIKDYEYSSTLPTNLRKRVENIIDFDFDKYDGDVFKEYETGTNSYITETSEEEDDEETRKIKAKKEGQFNESTCSEIERMEHEYLKFELKIDMPIERKRASEKRQKQWLSKYVCQPRKERVKWDSKIYQMEENIWEKTLDEQAEILMDASAERFTSWLNGLSVTTDSQMTKDQLKALFSIEGDRRLLASILTEPKEVKAIAKTVADKWNLPEMAIELKYERYLENRYKNVPKSVQTVAFGRTIPVNERPWVPSDSETFIKTCFPDELLSGQKLFKGIGHLRSVRTLVKFLRNNPNLERPRYLEENDFFKVEEKQETKVEMPLYDLLRLKY